MNKRIAASIIAASLTGGALVGSALGGPSLAGAAETAGDAAGWVQDALSGLVEQGTITEQQADAVESALQEARPERPPGHHRHGGRVDLSVVAEALGMTEDELRSAFQADKTVADLAAEKGVDLQTVIDGIVASHKARLDEKVAAGDLTQEEADEKLAGAEERATAFVNGEVPPGGRHGHGGPRPDGPPPDESADEPTDAAA